MFLMHRKGAERISRCRLYCLLVVKSGEAPGLPYPSGMTFGCGSSRVTRSPLFFGGGVLTTYTLCVLSQTATSEILKKVFAYLIMISRKRQKLCFNGEDHRGSHKGQFLLPVSLSHTPLTSLLPTPFPKKSKLKSMAVPLRAAP